ncbi:MAG: hypothetical protein NDI73_01060 [Desulfuromonadales bacterium]|nr:hypothetical protein [Desulfuromonadales bacterium]
MKGLGIALLTGLVFLVGGCAYYQVKDPVSEKIYYTKDYDKIHGGAVRLRDARTGAVVIIQNSEVKEISKEDFNLGRFAPENEVK